MKSLVALLIIILLFLNYSLYKDKKMYEEYISNDVFAHIYTLISSIIDNNEIYEDILEKGYITRNDADMLKMNAYNILELTQTYGGLAYEFKRIGNKKFYNITAEQSAKIASFFFEMNKGEEIYVDNVDEVIFELNNDMEEKIVKLKELNSLWLVSALKNTVGMTDNDGNIEFNRQEFEKHYGDNILSDDVWVNLIFDIDENTKRFLSDNKWISMEDILQD